jgi:hypothetical protein
MHFTTSERDEAMGPSCCTVQIVEATYLTLLVVTFLAIGAMSIYILLKLFAGQR